MRFVFVAVICAAFFLVPLALRGASSQASTTRPVSRTPIVVGSTDSHWQVGYQLAAAQVGLPSPTTVAPAPPTTVRVTTTVKRTTTTVKKTTTTTAKPKPTTTLPPHSLSGSASWWNTSAGSCAMNVPPLGTVVTVTNVANGKTVTCTVRDRGPHVGGRIIDLDQLAFDAIGDSSQGVISVRVTW